MEFLHEWIIPLIAIVSPIVAVAIAVTQKDSSLQEKNSNLKTAMDLRFDQVHKDIKTIMSNHLPHIDEKINKVFAKQNALSGEVVELRTTLKMHLKNHK